MDSAERLVAERGAEAASSRAIIMAAGQRHNSAITYHFGSRKKLFDAVWIRGSGVVNRRRQEMLGTDQTWTLAELVDIYLSPLADYIGSRSPSYWARLNEEALRSYPVQVASHMRQLLDEYPREQPMDTLHAIFDRMQWMIADATEPDAATRVSIAVRATISTFAAWEREEQAHQATTTAAALGHDLRKVVLAILTAP